MIKTEQTNILCFEGLYNTILNDRYTFRWFVYFLSYKENMERIEQDQALRNTWSENRKINLLLFAIRVVILSLFIMSAALNMWELILIAMPFIFISFFVSRRIRKGIAELSCDIVRKDFSEEEISKMTLYQLCEEYSEKYSIVSLVDAIYHLDRIYRTTLFISFIFVYLVIKVEEWWVRFMIVLIIYLVVKYIANDSAIYKLYKRS